MGLAKALYDDQQFRVEKYMGVYVKHPDFALKNGVMYSDRLPGTALLMIPYFAYAQVLDYLGVHTANPEHEIDIVLASLMPPLFGVLTAILLFGFSYRIVQVSFRLSVVSTVIFSFGTLSILESSHLFSHAPSLFFVSLAVLIAIADLSWKLSKKLLVIAGLLGFASWIELQNFLFIGPVLLYLFLKEKKLGKIRNTKFVKPTILSLFVIALFLLALGYYNYLVFEDFTLKSNKYNPFFPEEGSFLTALSGDFIIGLDKLFTSFSNLESYWNPRVARLNNIPGVFVTSPVLLLSAFGFFLSYKKFPLETLLFLGCIFISVVIAALHVTTLVRHIHTSTLFMFIPFVFTLEYILNNLKGNLKKWVIVILVVTILISLIRVSYSTFSYWGRTAENFFLYAQEWRIFLWANLPIFIVSFYLFYREKTSKLLV